MGDPTSGARGMTDRSARLVLSAALIASALLLFHYRQDIGFLADDLIFLRDRSVGGLDTLLVAHYEHIAVLLAALYRLMYMVFGIDSPVPFQLVSLLAFLASMVVFFLYLRKQVGEPVAAIAAIPVLFMGTAYHDLLWTFQIGFSLSIGFGLTALVALNVGSRRGDAVACLALVLAILTASLSLPFLVAAAVLLLRRDGWNFWRNPVLLLPALLYLLWYLGWGREAESFFNLANLSGTPAYVAESIKSVVMGLTGIHRLPSPLDDIMGWLVSAGLVIVTAWHLIRRKSVPVEFQIAIVAGLTFWVLLSLNQAPGIEGRSPDQSRFQYPGAVFLLMILAGAFCGMRPGRLVQAGFGALAAVSVVASLGLFSTGKDEMRVGADYPRAGMTALDIAGDESLPAYELNLVPYFDVVMTQDRYRELTDRYGAGGWDQQQIDDLSDELRGRVDAQLAAVLGLELTPGPAVGEGRCELVVLDQVPQQIVSLESGRVTVRTKTGESVISAGRFADGYPVTAGTVSTGRTGAMKFSEDLSPVPWRVAASGTGQARVCVTN